MIKCISKAWKNPSSGSGFNNKLFHVKFPQGFEALSSQVPILKNILHTSLLTANPMLTATVGNLTKTRNAVLLMKKISPLTPYAIPLGNKTPHEAL